VTQPVKSASVIDLRAYVDPSVVPTLVLVDLQQEYIAAPPRMLALPDAAQALANCRVALAHARAKGFPVAFVRWLGRSALFNPATRFSRWIDGFEPTGADMVFERDQPSCYASSSFGEVMGEAGGNFVLAGFAGESACLATAVDAFHRGHSLTYLVDASASHRLDDVGAPDVHRVISRVVELYGEVISTKVWVAATSRKQRWRGTGYATEQDRTA
jgi:nicotinamidase-related amidase